MASNKDFLGHLVKFNSLASGRDKVARLVQYASKFVWWHLQQRRFNPGIIVKLKNLDTALGTMRKALRLGKSVDFIYSALHTIHISDTVLRLTITLSKLNQACYLLFDHIIWAGRVGLASVDAPKWKHLAARFWLVTIVLNLVRDIYGMWQVIIEELKNRNAKATRNGDVDYQHKGRCAPSDSEVVMSCMQENLPLILDFVRNLCDLVLPLTALKHIHTSTGLQGLVGMISSMVGIITTWNPDMKLIPS